MNSNALTPMGEVAEIQGLYGPFSFPEKLLQKLWLRRDFDTSALVTADGRQIELLHPGRWNLLGGPDFRGARLRIEGVETTGDIEVHLHAADWQAHGHARDAAYADVVLHVVLFPPTDVMTPGWGGKALPILALLPWLHHDLEEYAAVEAVETLANRPSQRILEHLGGLPPEDLQKRLREHADRRWEQKVRFARVRVERLGWEGACHHTALEILGYRFNRAPMLQLATAHPLAHWNGDEATAERFFAEMGGRWSLQGVRPANHPRGRLAQYLAWNRARSEWPSVLANQELPLVDPDSGTADSRRMNRLVHLRERWQTEIGGGSIGGTRFDTLVCDGFLPLLATRLERTGKVAPGFAHWFHWFPGDLPAYLLRGLRDLGLAGVSGRPYGHGLAQGLLGWQITQEKSVATESGATPLSLGGGA